MGHKPREASRRENVMCSHADPDPLFKTQLRARSNGFPYSTEAKIQSSRPLLPPCPYMALCAPAVFLELINLIPASRPVICSFSALSAVPQIFVWLSRSQIKSQLPREAFPDSPS